MIFMINLIMNYLVQFRLNILFFGLTQRFMINNYVFHSTTKLLRNQR